MSNHHHKLHQHRQDVVGNEGNDGDQIPPLAACRCVVWAGAAAVSGGSRDASVKEVRTSWLLVGGWRQ